MNVSPEALNSHSLNVFLEQGEQLVAPPEHIAGDTRDMLGYEYFPIQAADGRVGDSVLLAVEPGGAVEPVTVTNPIKLLVQPVSGRGQLFVYYRHATEANVYEFDSTSPAVIPIHFTATYGYKNTGTEPFIVRDDASPAFEEGDETSLLSDAYTEVPHAFLLQYSNDPEIQAQLRKLAVESE